MPRKETQLGTAIGSFSSPPPPPPTSHELQYISVTSGFTRLSMKTKYVCRGLISLYINFQNNRTILSTNFYVKNCMWGGKRKRALQYYVKERHLDDEDNFSPKHLANLARFATTTTI